MVGLASLALPNYTEERRPAFAVFPRAKDTVSLAYDGTFDPGSM